MAAGFTDYWRLATGWKASASLVRGRRELRRTSEADTDKLRRATTTDTTTLRRTTQTEPTGLRRTSE